MPVLKRLRPKNNKINDWLIRHAMNIKSQNGEDGIIQKIFEVIGIYNKSCVEIGAWDGQHLSNTWNLLNNNQWNGILVEADAERFQNLKAFYEENPKVECLQILVNFEGENALDKIFERALFPKVFDLLSIDIDGADYHLWSSLESYRPRVVIIEYNPSIPNNILYIQDKDMEVYQGSSLLALTELGKLKGYELICTTTFNAFFVLSEYYDLFNIKDNSLDMMHNVPMQTEFFQLYDGTLKIAGCKKFIWHKVKINEDNLQQLSSAQRQFPYAPQNCTNSENDKIAEIEEFKNSRKHSSEYFLNLGKSLFNKYSDENVQKVFCFALDVCNNDQKDNITSIIAEHYCIIANTIKNKKRSIRWYKSALYINKSSLSKSQTANIMFKLGALYCKDKQIDKSAFWFKMANLNDLEAKGKVTERT